MYTIAGSWEGALLTDNGDRETRFAMRQPLLPANDTGPIFLLDGAAAHTRLLEGTASSFVALADTPDGDGPSTAPHAHLLLEGRLLGDRLVGRWLRRDADGAVVASGRLMGTRAA
jgi:hypothetical protein